ncbi:MAG: glycosyltransferase [Gammaproteobacteria bacterium]|nr:glycosyltransferase [Gammaproteobacteria bacterium]MCW8927665.1 glycosyltransferase [Gammaproteobacteria bacterium]MCW8972390.1 glycosyltransferase [Gammaproteobacteria bacterium]MCW8992640.1 glycosyltransferase [Gammaproteobacteria bacterium]
MDHSAARQHDHEEIGPARKLLTLTFLAIAIWYLSWRAGTLNPDAMAFSLLIYGAELFGFMTALLHIFMTWRLKCRVSPPVPEGLRVAVFIPTFDESEDLVRNTLIAALHMDYPHETWLLDDGNRPSMRAQAEELGVRYLARSDNTHAKAGNLNHALAHTDADFIAVFDADHAPQRHFLERTLGYLAADDKVAFVQTPQDFFNLDSYQHRQQPGRRAVWTEQSLFFRVIQRGKDTWNAAFFCGSCAVVRRSALDRIGGFATETVTEDLHTSIRLHKLGYRSVYHPESLAFGVAPSSVVPFLKQRIRWGQGAMQVWRREGVLTARGLTLAQRLNYFASMVTYFDGWQKAIFYLAPVVVLVTGVMPISTLSMEFFIRFVPYYVLSFWLFEELGRGYGRTVITEQYNMGRFAAFAWATLALFRRRLPFSVTHKGHSRVRDAYRYFTPQFLVLMLNAVALPLGLALYITLDDHLPLEGAVANLFWASLNMALALSMVWFTLNRADQRRSEYRFPIPLPARIHIDGGAELLVTVDDISSAGCRFYGPLPESLEIGTPVSGEIALPSGNWRFRARTASQIASKRAEEHYTKAIGCEFQWQNSAERDALKLFLYGSDLQWHLHHLSERARTPLERLTGRRGVGLRAPALEHWCVMTYQITGSSDSLLGLVSLPPDEQITHQLLTFQPLPQGALFQGRLSTRTRHARFSARTGVSQTLESPIAPLYLTPVSAFELEQET